MRSGAHFERRAAYASGANPGGTRQVPSTFRIDGGQSAEGMLREVRTSLAKWCLSMAK